MQSRSYSLHQYYAKLQLSGFVAIFYRQRHLINEFHIVSIEIKAKGVIMHAKSVNCEHTAFMCCSLGSCTCRMYTCKPVEMHLNHIPLFPFASNHTLSAHNVGNTHHDSHGNGHTFANIAANWCICFIHFCICASHYSPVWVHHVWHSVHLLCPEDQTQVWQRYVSYESYARLTLICSTCNFC